MCLCTPDPQRNVLVLIPQTPVHHASSRTPSSPPAESSSQQLPSHPGPAQAQDHGTWLPQLQSSPAVWARARSLTPLCPTVLIYLGHSTNTHLIHQLSGVNELIYIRNSEWYLIDYENSANINYKYLHHRSAELLGTNSPIVSVIKLLFGYLFYHLQRNNWWSKDKLPNDLNFILFIFLFSKLPMNSLVNFWEN